MKFQRTPLILLLIALGLGGFVYCAEFQPPPKPTETQAATPIFSFKEQDIRALKIQSARNQLAFEKSATPIAAPQKAEKDAKAGKDSKDVKAPPAGKESKEGKAAKSSPPPSSFWQLTEPEKVPASDGQVAFLLNLLATGKSDRSFTVPVARLAEFGLNQPTATIEVQLSNQQSHKLLLGLPNFDRKSVYAQVDPPANPTGDVTVLLVPFDFYQAVDRPLSDWKLVPDSPPPIASPTPTSPEGEAPGVEAAPAVSPTSSPTSPSPAPPGPGSPKPKPSVSASPTPEPR